jgi:type I restriction enzyme M protein
MDDEFTLTPVKKKDLNVQKKLDSDSKDCKKDTVKELQLKELYDRLWGAADELRANSKLKSTQYSTPVLGLLFLRYADYKFSLAEGRLTERLAGRGRPVRKLDYQREGVIFLPGEARYSFLLELPEGANIGKRIDDAMRMIEAENEELRDVLPKVYTDMEDRVLVNLLKLFNPIPVELDRDIFGKIYEYFLGKFAMAEGQGAGEFYTPTSIVRLIVEILEPMHGRILDPACGSGGMFVQSAEFVKEHKKQPHREISIYGQERVVDTVRLCKMNLAIHGLSGDIRQGNTYYEDTFDMWGKFDYVMANPPFNVNNVDKESARDDPRYPFGVPSVDNANYLWIQAFYSALNDNGRVGFVIANSANDARYSEQEIRKKLIQEDVVDVIVSVASNFFYTVTLPVSLWFLNKNKREENTNKVLFIDATEIFQQIDRAHREFTDQQLEYISNIVRLYRNLDPETRNCSSELLKENFPEMKYRDIKGLCKVSTIREIKDQGWSLNPGKYVGIELNELEHINFEERIRELLDKFEKLNFESKDLEVRISKNLKKLV